LFYYAWLHHQVYVINKNVSQYINLIWKSPCRSLYYYYYNYVELIISNKLYFKTNV